VIYDWHVSMTLLSKDIPFDLFKMHVMELFARFHTAIFTFQTQHIHKRFIV